MIEKSVQMWYNIIGVFVLYNLFSRNIKLKLIRGADSALFVLGAKGALMCSRTVFIDVSSAYGGVRLCFRGLAIML